MQSVVPCAHDPGGVLCGLNRILQHFGFSSSPRPICALTQELARRCTQRRDIRLFYTGAETNWSASRVTASFLE
jgi:hypothetical protein